MKERKTEAKYNEGLDVHFEDPTMYWAYHSQESVRPVPADAVLHPYGTFCRRKNYCPRCTMEIQGCVGREE